ncbi:TetR/AcrR family transcriptional regulator [Anaerosporobacter faecicola]|uniref:TetR/AcrR family transcriptional regulator n=1 Tax=Anaerosporobacter faecicola TaxID=2718714 RepID=UPI00143A1CDF|nr:TetR/AcrR family transcriptional regulator [Anaerosporobacter faecicola]
MPPKNKVEREQIIDAAFEMMRQEGFESITTRKLATKLECSTQPIYYIFKNMDELRKEVYVKARAFFTEEVRKSKNTKDPEFLAAGVAYIMKAKEESQLFRFITMGNNYSLDGIEDLMKGTHLPDKEADLFFNMWIYAHGIAAIVSVNDVKVEEENIRKILLRAAKGFDASYETK